MRICYIGDAPSPHVQKWAMHFAREHEVHVLSFRGGAIPGAQVHELGRFRTIGKSRYPLETQRIRQLLREVRPDVVHALHLTSYGFVAALSGARPLISSVWGYDILQAPRRSPLHAWITRFALSRADIVTATGEALAEATRPYMASGRPVHVVPYGIDLDQFAPRTPAGETGWPSNTNGDGPVIGSVKALLPEKGFEFLLEALPAVVDRHPGARLLLAGEGPEHRRLERWARELGMGSRVEFLGAVPHERVPEILRRIDLFVQPSLTESFGVSAIEASATGIPVIATAVEGGRDIVRHGETGLLVQPASGSALAAAILQILGDPALGRSMGEAGRRFVAERYQWRDNAAQMAALYAAVVEGCSVGSR